MTIQWSPINLDVPNLWNTVILVLTGKETMDKQTDRTT